LTKLNGDISSLQILINAKTGGVSIVSVNQTGDGYQITFSDGNTISLRNGIDGITPTIGTDGYWYIGTQNTGIKAEGSDGVTPTVGTNGNWWIGNTDTGVKAVGVDGITPHIGTNGNWWIGNTDTGVSASGGGSASTTVVGVPIIGVQEYEGVYYWTQTINGVTTWLTDKNGNKLPVSGKDAMTPMIQVNVDGYWVISYNGGITWTVIVDESGKPVKATGSGECHCQSFFQSVTYADGILTLVLIDGTTVQIKCKSDDDIRIDIVVPEEMQKQLETYMPIYRGVNPPIIEGVYKMEPTTTVFCADFGNGGSAPGTVTNTLIMYFKNQNTTQNILDYEQYEFSVGQSSGTGAYISGNGDNFTAFFNVESDTHGLHSKQAVVISGTKTAVGIANLFYAVGMVEKDADPDHKMMNVGVIRVYKDGDAMSEVTTWPASVRRADSEISTWNLHSFVKNVIE
jgi:hypothetical protein